MIRKIFLCLLLGFLTFPSVFSLGVSPGIVEIDFTPNFKTNFQMGVVNTPAKDQDVEVYVNLFQINEDVREEFRDIISLEKTSLSFIESEGGDSLLVSLNFPEGFSKGGIHELRVGARPAAKGEGGTSISAGNEIRILVNVPEEYVDEKYAIKKELKILNINAQSVKKGENSDIKILIKSESEINLEVYAIIKVLRNDQEFKTLETDKVNIGPNEEKTLTSFFNTEEIPVGPLVIDVEVFYSDNSVKSTGSMSILKDDVSKRGIEIIKDKNKFLWLWILILIILLIAIFLILFLLLRRKKKDPQQVQQTNNSPARPQ